MNIIRELPTHWKKTENLSLWYISGISSFTLPVNTCHQSSSVIEKQKHAKNNRIMKISNSFKISTLNLKLLESKRPFLLFAEILSTKLFPQSKYTKQSKLKAILETSTFQIPKFEIFISMDHCVIFYSNFPKTFFILKMSKKKPKFKMSTF